MKFGIDCMTNTMVGSTSHRHHARRQAAAVVS
jgi:hypothetical protein